MGDALLEALWTHGLRVGSLFGAVSGARGEELWVSWFCVLLVLRPDLDAFLRYYNLERSHQGYRLKGRTPAQALREALAVDALPPIVLEQEVTPENEPDTLAA